MRKKAVNLAIANRLLEAYRERVYGKKSLDSITSKREPGEPNKTEYQKVDKTKFDKDMEYWKQQNRKGSAQTRMRHKGNVPKKDGKPMFEATGNKFAAKQTWGKSLVGQTFYAKCTDDSRYYKTIFIRFNPFTNAMQPMMSNPIYGEPPDTMEPINPLILQRLLRLQQTATFEGF